MCWLTWHPEQRRMPERPSCNLLIYGWSASLSLSDLTSKEWIKNAIMLGKQIYCCEWLCNFFFFLFWPCIKWAKSGPWRNHSNAFGPWHHMCSLRFLLSNVSVYYIIHGNSKGEPDGCVFPSLGFSNKRKKESGAVFRSDETDRPLEVIISVFKEGSHLQQRV